ncbi:MAG: hypothetical protein JWP64_2839 [Pseudonocardia sp.]|jgi:hypothetical protein|uniref:hypothetical protein n=1 Tax=Pseudonocardia sp. TaxID=60912 RepID=UPI0026305346|nr:hypothetical protein [Pseudonocardia sp.]MCU1627890.1 hypothetical protein [Pseudonocardia sp.]MDT7704130.1 hypothetical protein [Pseudonocardiales bacterium]
MPVPVRPPGLPGPEPVDRTGAAPRTAPGDGLARAYARAAGLSGIVFAVLFTLALVLVRQGPGLGDPDPVYAAFYASDSRALLVTVGLYVVPFAGIACLWHMIATRTLLQVLAPRSWSRIPHWLQLASGVVFVCMLFAGTAAVGGAALLTRFSDSPPPSAEIARALAAVGYAMVFVYGVRAAGMYMISTTGLARTVGLLPGPAAAVSYLVAAFLLVSTTFHPVILLVFPAWVLVLSIVLLVRRPTGANTT